MALYLLRANWSQGTTDERDIVVWGYNVEAAVAPTADQWETAFAGALAAGDPSGDFRPNLPNALSVEELQVYDVVAGGPPVDEKVPSPAIVGTGAATAPAEVALVVTRWMLDGLGRPFKKGRQYIGPLTSGVVNGGRPSGTLRTACLNFTVALHLNFEANGWTPVIDTKGALHVGEDIYQYSCDDAWDTQRRRGWDPTTETVRVPGA